MSADVRSIDLNMQQVQEILLGHRTAIACIVNCYANASHLDTLLGEWGLSKPPHRWRGDREEINWRWNGRQPQIGDWIEQYQTDVDDHASCCVECPYGEIDSLLWVREEFTLTQFGKPVYRADATDQTGQRWSSITPEDPDGEVIWQQPSAMIESQSRLTLRVDEIDVKRLSDLTDDDAEQLGIVCDWGITGANCNGGTHHEEHGWRYSSGVKGSDVDYHESAIEAFIERWDSEHETDDQFFANKWIWFVSFTKEGK